MRRAGIFIFLFFISVTAFAYTDIEVTGIFLDEQKGNVALINGAPYSVGESINEAQILKIASNGVTFSLDGHTFFEELKVNNLSNFQTPPHKAPTFELKMPVIKMPAQAKPEANAPQNQYVSNMLGSFEGAKNITAMASEKNKKTEEMMNQILDGK
jgi:hypothetical protein